MEQIGRRFSPVFNPFSIIFLYFPAPKPSSAAPAAAVKTEEEGMEVDVDVDMEATSTPNAGAAVPEFPTDEGLADPEYLQQILEGLPNAGATPKKEPKSPKKQ